MSNALSVIREFSWCENADQKVGAMASEIIYLRMHVKALQEKLAGTSPGLYKMVDDCQANFYPLYSTSIEGDKEHD